MSPSCLKSVKSSLPHSPSIKSQLLKHPSFWLEHPSASSTAASSFPGSLSNSVSQEATGNFLPPCPNNAMPSAFFSLKDSLSFFKIKLRCHVLCESCPDSHHPTPGKGNNPILCAPKTLCNITLILTIIIREWFALLHFVLHQTELLESRDYLNMAVASTLPGSLLVFHKCLLNKGVDVWGGRAV